MANQPGTADQPSKQCILHKAYTHITIAEIMYHAVEFLKRKFCIPKISYTDDSIHSAYNLIQVLKNPEPASPLVTLGNAHKEALIFLDYL